MTNFTLNEYDDDDDDDECEQLVRCRCTATPGAGFEVANSRVSIASATPYLGAAKPAT